MSFILVWLISMLLSVVFASFLIEKIGLAGYRLFVVNAIYVSIICISYIVISYILGYLFGIVNKKIISIKRLKIKVVPVGISVALIVSISANLITISGGSIANHIIRLFQENEDIETINKIHFIINNTDDFDIKEAGIRTLGQIKSKETLITLIEISKFSAKFFDKENILGLRSFYHVLAAKIGEYGEDAMPLLFSIFRNSEKKSPNSYVGLKKLDKSILIKKLIV